jgi:pectate lyase/pectin methylesterase-like acyl-CoA thioesterase
LVGAKTQTMKRLLWLLALAGALLLAFTLASVAAALVDDTFADGNSQNQDLANNSLRLFNGRANTARTEAVGSVSFDVTNASGSEAFWAYFTNAGAPLRLGVGDRLAVALNFSLAGFGGAGQDVRFGVLDSLGTRNSANLTAGMNDATFVNDSGYSLQFYASGQGAPFVIGRRTTLTSANVFNSFADFTAVTSGASGATARQTLANGTPYTLSYTIERLSATETRITAAVTGGALSDLNYTVVESSPVPNTTFDYFAFRIAGPAFATKLIFMRLSVAYTPAPPVITSQPQPSSVTVQVGSNVTLAVAATGSALSYQWQKNEVAIGGNASASTPTLNLTSVQLGDAGNYTCVVSNAGGSVRSNAVRLNVTTEPVPPPPSIIKQPTDTTVTVGAMASFSVNATGAALVYQWFKNGALLAGATEATLSFASAQVSDAGSYTVVVSNSSGSVTSAPAALLVVSTLAVTNLAPGDEALNVCIDTSLQLTFDQAPQIGRSGRVRVYRADDTLVDTIDLSLNAQTKNIGTASAPFNYFPIIITGNTAAIYLHQALEYDQSYYVTIEPGVLTDMAGVPFAGISAPNVWRFSTKALGPASGSAALTVAADGRGDFCTVQGAVDFAPVGNTQRVTITVQRGIYQEIVYISSNKPFITVRGEDRELSVIQYANNANLNAGNNRAMFGVDAADFTLENITLVNSTPRGGSQAEAFRGGSQTGQRILLNHVNLKSFQDTLLLQGRAFVNDSYIEGDVDFMWGNGAAFFQNCELKAVAPGFYAQVRNPQGGNGNVYVNCRLTGLPTLTGVYLARVDPNVFPYSQVVFINCALGPHILPTGWLLNNATAAPNVQFWEYQSTNLNGAPLDVSQRAPFSRQLSAAEAAQWSNPAFVLSGWTPVALTVSPSLVLMDEALTVNYLAPGGNRATDWVGLFRVGEPDANPIAQLPASASINNNLIFKPPAAAGRYEFRYFRGDGSRAATSNTVTLLAAPSRRSDAPLGFAAVNALGQNGTTGGAGGQTVTVTTAAEFLAAIARPEPLIIRVVGMLTLPGPMHDVASHKTIVGVGANSGLSGGGLNIGLPANDNLTEPPPNAVKNVIIRNLRFTNLPDDAINLQMFTHHVWIDHCDFSNGFDGLIDVKRGSDYVTISWNRLHQHSKTSLVGHDDNNGAQDSGRLKVTYHHNWFDDTLQRNPRVRFGEPVHVFNNFYLNNAEVGAACFVNSGCLIEGNYFENVRTPITINNEGPPGRAVERLNVYVRSGAPVVGGGVIEPRAFYRYTLDNAADVRTVVTQGAGVGKLRF